MASFLVLLVSSFAFAQNVPMVALAYWNDDYSVTGNNNCYNYGTNRATGNYAQPGQASGISSFDLNCGAALKAASADLGMTQTSFFPYTAKHDESLIALVVAPDFDFHWYRRGDDGLWTHKMGSSPATNLDSSGNTITSPETADRGSYSDFCGYFRIKNFVYQKDEQNGGYVRIGNMKSLPDTAPEHPSVVRVLKYSGRPDPELSLQDLLRDENLKKEMTDLARQVAAAPPVVASQAQVSSLQRLGFRGIMVWDREGLVFPKGTRVQVKGTQALIYLAGSRAPVGLALKAPLQFEQQLRRR